MRSRLLSCLLIIAVATGMILVGFAPQAQAADKKEIIFGGSLGLSGKFAELGRLMKDAFELWMEDTNKAGGIYVKEYGRKMPVKYILYDDQSDPATGAKLYEKLITHDKVDFLTAPFSSGITFAGSTVAEKYKKIMISVCGSSNDIYNRGFDYIFCHVGFASNHMNSNIDLIDNLKPRPKGIAIVTDKRLYCLTVAEATRDKLKKLGFEIVLYEEFPTDIKDASSVINKIKALNPDIFLGFTSPPSCALFSKQTKMLNLRPKMIYFNEGPEMGWYVPEFGKDAEGITSRFAMYADPANPRLIEFLKSIKKKDPKWDRKVPDSIYHCGPYDSCEMLRQGIEGAGTLDNTKVVKYLRTNDLENMLNGLGQKAVFKDISEYKNINVNLVPVATQIQNGKIMVVWPKGFAQAEAWYPLGPWPK